MEELTIEIIRLITVKAPRLIALLINTVLARFEKRTMDEIIQITIFQA